VSLRRIQALTRHGLYYLTEHALDEASDDDLDVFDVEHAILKGRVRRTWPDTGTIELVGPALDGRTDGVVCLATAGAKVRVVTVCEDRPRAGGR
jgi:hypothetical protein